MDKAFKALADPVRRQLLDRLFDRDGQTLQELCARIAMTRFGVMKHLRVLGGAGLVVTRRAGRTKLHYLNPVPIRQVHDRWVSRYTAPFAGALTALKTHLEDPMAQRPRHVFEVYIRATAEQVWRGLTDPAFSRRYFHESAVASSWKPGAPITYTKPDGTEVIHGEVLAVDPPRRLVHTFRFPTDPQFAGDRPSRVTWEIEPRGDACRVVLVHDDFDGETATFRGVGGGWPPILSGLKTLLETGQPLVIGPARGAGPA